MKGILGLLDSKKGIGFLGLIAAATVLTALGHLSVMEWRDTCLIAFGIYAGAETAHGVTALLKGRK